MNSIDLIRMGLKNLFRRKVRTFLTILGVIIGTSAIVVMVSLGFGMNESFKQEISRMGSLNIINVMPSYGMGPGAPGGGGGKKSGTLDDKAVASISKIEGVQAVTPLLETSVKLVSGKYMAYVQLVGIVPDTMQAFEFKLKEGRLLQNGDELNMVFGGSIPMAFFDSKSRNMYYQGPPAEPKVKVLTDKIIMTFDMSYGDKRPVNDPGSKNTKPPKLYKIKGVGLLNEGNPERDYYVFMDITEVSKLLKEYNRSQAQQGRMGSSQQTSTYQRVMVRVKDMKNVQKVQKQIKEMGYEAYSLTDYLESMQKTAATLQMILGGIGAISLLVAALGITNTMIMSIYERTREIGIMKVIGASFSDIRRLFLFESGMIGFLGGLLGLGFSKLASMGLNSLTGQSMGFFGPVAPGSKISLIPLWLMGAVLIFSTFVGLISGFYPARRAMKLSALEAIRTE